MAIVDDIGPPPRWIAGLWEKFLRLFSQKEGIEVSCGAVTRSSGPGLVEYLTHDGPLDPTHVGIDWAEGFEPPEVAAAIADPSLFVLPGEDPEDCRGCPDVGSCDNEAVPLCQVDDEEDR